MLDKLFRILFDFLLNEKQITITVIIIIINNKIIIFFNLPRINVASIASTEYERVLVNSVSYTPRYLSV